MTVSITVRPIADGRESEWRAFVDRLSGERRIEWAESQRRCGISRQVMSAAFEDPSMAITFVEAADPDMAARLMLESSEPFDVWFRDTVDALLGDPVRADVMLDSARRRGPWRGWRLRRWPR